MQEQPTCRSFRMTLKSGRPHVSLTLGCSSGQGFQAWDGHTPCMAMQSAGQHPDRAPRSQYAMCYEEPAFQRIGCSCTFTCEGHLQ